MALPDIVSLNTIDLFDAFMHQETEVSIIRTIVLIDITMTNNYLEFNNHENLRVN